MAPASGLVAWLRRRPATASPAVPLPPPARPSMIGAAAPSVAGIAPAGDEVAARVPQGVVLFLTSTCLGCRGVWASLARRGEDGPPGHLPVVVVTPDPSLEDAGRVGRLGVPGLDVVMSTATWLAYGAGPSPWVAVVASGVVVAEGTVADWDGVVAMAGAAPAYPVRPGPAPPAAR